MHIYKGYLLNYKSTKGKVFPSISSAETTGCSSESIQTSYLVPACTTGNFVVSSAEFDLCVRVFLFRRSVCLCENAEFTDAPAAQARRYVFESGSARVRHPKLLFYAVRTNIVLVQALVNCSCLKLSSQIFIWKYSD